MLLLHNAKTYAHGHDEINLKKCLVTILQFKGALTTLVISLSIQSNVCNKCFCDKMTDWNNKSNS